MSLTVMNVSILGPNILNQIPLCLQTGEDNNEDRYMCHDLDRLWQLRRAGDCPRSPLSMDLTKQARHHSKTVACAHASSIVPFQCINPFLCRERFRIQTV